MAQTATTDPSSPLARVNIPIFAITGGFIVLFCLLALVDLDLLGSIV